jgi:DNA-binding CsgD family transcriptional regulator/pimeloyl-ACP methyl ester carboxylesterase
MEPRIEFVKTKDGVSIAYAKHGRGPAIVQMGPWPFCHLGAEWSIPTLRQYNERLGSQSTVVRFDGRGAGLSQRNVADLSLDARLSDLEAVVDRLQLDSFDLSAYGTNGPIGIEFAARHPERVDHLILWEAFANPIDYLASPAIEGLVGLANTNWEMFTETAAGVFFGWSAGEEARTFAAVLRECVSADQGRACFAAALSEGVDVRGRLTDVQMPVLVLYCREAKLPGEDVARSLASAIPSATLICLEGSWITSNQLADAAAGAILGFVETQAASGGAPQLDKTRRFAGGYPAGLSKREVEVLLLVAAGRTNREIAEALVISINTVERHVSHILAKTDSANRAEAAGFAIRHGLTA